MPSAPCSPFLFILNQLEAAELAAKKAADPPKRPRGRPPKVVEEPLLPNAYRHVLSDEDSEFDKHILSLNEELDEQPVAPQAPTDGKLAIVIPTQNEKYICVFEGKVIGTSKHQDYWEYHYSRGDLRNAANLKIGKFVRVTLTGDVERIFSAACGHKCNPLPLTFLTSAEMIEIGVAVQAAHAL
jgi:hypothetical protein